MNLFNYNIAALSVKAIPYFVVIIFDQGLQLVNTITIIFNIVAYTYVDD